MTSSILVRSLMTTLTYTVLILTLAGCGPGFDDGSGSERGSREPSEIEIRYSEMRAERQERLRTHTGEGPVFTDEEKAEFKRVEQLVFEQIRAEKEQRKEEEKQSRLRETYDACDEGYWGNCREIFRVKVEEVDGDAKRRTVRTTAKLPNNIIAEYYFGLLGEGCTSEDPVNTWTDVDAVTIRYTGDGDVPPEHHRHFGKWGVRLAECEVNTVLRTADILLEIPLDVPFMFEVEPSFEDVRVACSQEEPYRCGGKLRLKTDFYGQWRVQVANSLPRNLPFEYYFDLAGTGCYTDAKLQEWTADNLLQIMGYLSTAIVIQHRGKLVNPRKTEDYVVAECELSVQARVAGETPVFIPRMHEWSSKRSRMDTPGTVIVPFIIAPE